MKIPQHKKKELPTIHKYRYDDLGGSIIGCSGGRAYSAYPIKVDIKSYDKDKNQISISDPTGEPYYLVEIGWYIKILTNSPEYYFVADSNGDFKKTVIKHRQELGSGDKVIINTALRKFRKNIRRSGS